MGQTGPPNPPGQSYPGAPVTVPTTGGSLYPPTQPQGASSSPRASPRLSRATASPSSTPAAPVYHGTVRANSSFNAQNEAEILRKAMKGFGTDEKAIIAVLGKLTNAERQKVSIAFKQMYGKDLIKDLKSELGGKLELIVLALMTPTALYDAKQLRAAMRGLGTDEACLIEILASRTNEQIHAIKAAYKTEMKRDLESDIMSETSGHFKRLLVSLCNGGRDEDSAPDRSRAAADAKLLYQAGAARMGTDESSFNRVLCAQSMAQLQLVFEEYHRATGKSIEQAVKSEMSGDLEDGFLAIVSCMKDRPAYFAGRLYKSMKGAGTDDQTLIRVVVSRCEVDMVQIKDAFQRNYGKSLVQFIKDDCSGDYERVLIALVN
jgi:annexin A7/11